MRWKSVCRETFSSSEPFQESVSVPSGDLSQHHIVTQKVTHKLELIAVSSDRSDLRIGFSGPVFLNTGPHSHR